ncbi:hypothetical protein QMK54_10465 [Pseudomonas sp. P5_109]|uniref:hypothetical protein n=1 Tax=Pseudomonas sp. P5_109 TaxID=3043441 RepID=UPI002A3690D2|nr:hypothetical protein [Pseudomonas sp. P5_109]WPN32137.1 hypothetical protein QMK54_10465 [Pseudomonas sp. P5_109]
MLNDYGKSLFKPLVSVQNVVLGLSALFIAALVITQVGLSSSEWASWVQAIGSIAAIIGATYIAGEQRRQKIEDEKKEKNEYVIKAYGVAEVCVGLIERISRLAHSGGGMYDPRELLPRAIATLSDCQLMLASVDVLRFESQEHTSAFVDIRFNASIVKGLWEQIVAAGEYNAGLNQINLDSSVEACRQSIQKMRTDLFPVHIV